MSPGAVVVVGTRAAHGSRPARVPRVGAVSAAAIGGVMSAALAACGGDTPAGGGAASATVVRDSAGITVVEFDPATLPVRSLAPEPTWSFESLATDAGEHVLSGVIPLPLEEDRIAIAERSTLRVWVGTPEDGDWTWGGGRGDGPSELQRITDFEIGPDGSMWVQDVARRRLVRFAGDGILIDATPYEDRGMQGPNWSIRSGTHYFLGSGGGPGDGVGVFRVSAPLLRWSGDEDPDTLALVPSVEWYVFDGGVGGTLLAPYAYGAGAPDGHWVGDSARPEVRFWVDGPSPRTVVRWPFVDADMERLGDSVKTATIDALPPAERIPEAEAILAAFPVSESVPQFTDLVARFDGGVAIGPWWPRAPAPAPRPPGEWTLLDAGGQPEARISLPRGFQPTWFGDGWVLGVRTDELGRERVERWAVAR